MIISQQNWECSFKHLHEKTWWNENRLYFLPTLEHVTKVSMGKAWFFKVYANNWEVLSLGFIYGYCKVQFHWKLQSLERNCYISWDQRYSCNENIYFTISRMVAWIRCGIIFLITSLVPLQSLSGSRFLNYWSSNFEI